MAGAQTRVSRSQKIVFGKECEQRAWVDDRNIVHFCSLLTMTVDVCDVIPLGKVTIPKGYTLVVHPNADMLFKKGLIAQAEAFHIENPYVKLHVVNITPNLRYLYAGEEVATGYLVKRERLSKGTT